MTSHNSTDNGGSTPPPDPGQGVADAVRESVTDVWDQLFRASILIAVIIAAYFLGKLLRIGYLRMQRGRPTSVNLLVARMLQVTAVAAGFVFGLSEIYHVAIWQSLATLGVLSLVLGFGMQNTVANLAAGFSLTMDKPFDVGDRIKVGETWGDVTSLGMRSTTIVTVNGEHVTIPNAVLDTQEVWNYTQGAYRKIRVDLPVSITYDSSIPLAEYLALQVARGTQGVLAYPDPAFRLMTLGSDGIEFQIRVWIDHAADRAAIRNSLLHGIKTEFDKGGVSFPFPHRTITYATDLPAPSKTPEFLSEVHQTKPVVLAAITQRPPPSIAERIVEFVDRLDARLVALHVRPPQDAVNTFVAQEAVNGFLQRAHQKKVPVEGRMEVGDLAQVIERVARQVDARLVVLGRTPKHRLGMAWQRRDYAAIGKASPAPVIVLDVERELDEHVIARWQRRLAPPEEPPEEKNPAAEDELQRDKKPREGG